MRLIGKFQNEIDVRNFSLFLETKEIENTVDIQVDKQENFSYNIWVHNEDDIDKAKDYYNEYIKNPKNKDFQIPIDKIIEKNKTQETDEDTIEPLKEIPPIVIAKKRPFTYKITSFFLGLCIFIFALNYFQEKIYEKKEGVKIVLTSVQYYLLFDVPYVLVQLDKLIKQYHIDLNKPLDEQPKEFISQWKNIQKEPYWRGFYDILLSLSEHKSNNYFAAPLFEKIRQGQIWRILSPTFLHKGFLHIIFNMLWLWILGKQLETRLTKLRYILFVVIVGIVTNILQYLMGGPYFLGFSGVIMGMIGFIWMRQKIAPWEGYPLPKAAILFISIYVFAMLGLQVFSFFSQAFGGMVLAPNIGNTAHISGAVMGIILGKIPFFSWRPDER